MTGIPKVVHFIFGMAPDFGGIPFGIVHYLSVRSAALSIRPEKINLYYTYEPSGFWWDRAIHHVNCHKVSARSEIFGRRLNHYAHRADVLRLDILRNLGGIYMDLDVIALKPFDVFLSHDCVMAEEGRSARHGLCNAIILSREKAPFLDRWIKSYREFDDSKWNQFSVKMPHKLAMEHPGEIHVLSYDKFFRPMWYEDELRQLFLSADVDLSNNHAVHLWQHGSYERYLKNLTEDYICSVDSAFNVAVRKFLN